MNIFNFITDILTNKKGTLLDNVDSEPEYNQYMINRWLSMYSPRVATIINQTVNRYYSIFDTKREGYKFLVSVLPVQRPYRINYVKKVKQTSNDDTAVINTLSKNLELSEREIRYYIDTHNIDIERLKTICH